MSNATVHDSDVLVIGGGAAACRAAIEASGPGTRVMMVDKGEPGRSGTTPLALHGFATTLDASDSEEALAEDIFMTGGGINDRDLVRRAVHDSHDEPAMLESFGVRFHRNSDGNYDIYQGDGHSRPHGLVFDEKENGTNVEAILAREAWSRGVCLVQRVMTTDLLVQRGQVYGAVGIDAEGNEHVFNAAAVVLAAGGANRVFSVVEPRIANNQYRTTGDALVLALRAGLPLVDMEMANFRNSPPASRLGARYVNVKGEAFMERYHPMAEHAPRGAIVEALYCEMQAGNGPIHMEITPESERVAAFSTGEYRDYVKAYKEGKRPPVTITFQRLLGGARIKDDASTEIKGLFAAGESAGGFHGGDRLQGAAFLETQVFGRLAGRGAAAFARTAGDWRSVSESAKGRRRLPTKGRGMKLDDFIKRVQQIAWNRASLAKTGGELQAGLGELEVLKSDLARGIDAVDSFGPVEAENLLLTAEAIIRASLAREETRATHHRRDFPKANPTLARVHTCVRMFGEEMSSALVPCRN